MMGTAQQPKTYDVFTFFNELDLLEIRLNILDPYVDYFVIAEATETFSGKPKRLFFNENKDRFSRFLPKIIHYVTNDVPANETEFRKRLESGDLSNINREIIGNALTSSNVPPGKIHWLKEFYQKESIKKALLGLSDDDICYVSDVDEIWSPHATVDKSKDDIFKLKQLVYVYYLNNRSNEPWAGTLVTKYKNIRLGCLNHLRTEKKTKYTYIENGGWHFTNMGGVNQVHQKLESYGHQEFNTFQVKSRLEERVQKNEDFIGRKFSLWQDELDLPEYALTNRKKYTHLFSTPTTDAKKSIDTIIVKVQAGLGNQLFQYALGRYLTLSRYARVKYDISWYESQTKRKYELNLFKVKAQLATPNEIEQYEGHGRLHQIFQRVLGQKPGKHIMEKQFTFDPTIIETHGPAYLEGFWQTEKYFSPIAGAIRRELTLREAPTGANVEMLQKIKATRSIALHVRRGDYVSDKATNAFHGTTTYQYYQTAIEEISAVEPTGTIFIFSDDPQWVRDNLQLKLPTILVDINPPERGYDDLRLMAACKHHVIANSTFSWWGAWLGESKGQLVIAPKRWFNDSTQDASDLVPDRWMRI